MEKGLRFFKNTVVEERRKISGKKMVVSLENCIFLSPNDFQNSFHSSLVYFYIGDKVRFLGTWATIKEIMFDENNTVLYRVEYDSGLQISVSQDLLQEELEMLKKKKEFKKDREKNQCSQSQQQSSSIAIPTPLKVESLLPSISVTTDISKKVGKQLDITVGEIFKFLSLQDSRNDLEKLNNILRIYKFLVQNPCYDLAIAKDKYPDISLDSIEKYPYSKTRIIALAFQHLLENVGVKSQIVVSTSLNSMSTHNTLLISFDGRMYFFDIEQERNLSMSDFSMAGLGFREYSSKYRILGILPPDENEELLPLPSTVCEKKINSMIINGYYRMIPDLSYPLEEKEKQKRIGQK